MTQNCEYCHEKECVCSPEIFDTCRECGPGWDAIVSDALSKIREECQKSKIRMYVHQIKEKYGELRIYLLYSSGVMEEIIEQATYKSRETCESCGRKGKTIIRGGWFYTRCDECWEKQNKYI